MNSKASKRTNPLRYAMGMFGLSIPINMFNTYMFIFYVDKMKLDIKIYSGALLFYAFFDAIDNPVYGYLSDRTRSKWGRRKPWLVIGAPLMLLSFIAFFSPPVSGGLSFVIFFITFLLLVETLNSLLLVNYGALFPDLYRDDKSRSTVNAIKQALQLVAMVIGIALTPTITNLLGYPITAVILGILGMGSVVYSALGSHENTDYIEAEKPKIFSSIKEILSNKKFWIASFANSFYSGAMSLVLASIPFYVKYALRLDDGKTTFISGAVLLVAVPSVMLWAWLIKKYSLLPVWRAAIIVLTVSFIPMFFVSTLITGILAGSLIGFGTAGFMATMDLVGSRILDEDKNRTGVRREGIFQSLSGFMNRLSGVMKSLAYFLVAVIFKYENGDQPGDNPEMAAKFLLIIFPVILMLLCIVASRLLQFDESLKNKTEDMS